MLSLYSINSMSIRPRTSKNTVTITLTSEGTDLNFLRECDDDASIACCPALSLIGNIASSIFPGDDPL